MKYLTTVPVTKLRKNKTKFKTVIGTIVTTVPKIYITKLLNLQYKLLNK